MTEDELKILEDARQLISKKENWCQKSFITDNGKMCSVGAIMKAMAPETTPGVIPTYIQEDAAIFARTHLIVPTYFTGPMTFNDGFYTTHQDILNMFDDTIQEAKLNHIHQTYKRTVRKIKHFFYVLFN